MFARVTTMEVDAVRISVDSAVQLFEERVLPRLRQQAGFCGVYVLANPDGTAMLVSFWETAEQAGVEGDDGFYAEELAKYVTLFRAPPGRRSYHVACAEHPEPAALEET